jgi:ATP-dependent helicase/nuclease subunit A
MEWTDSQREAIETRGRRVIVSAGAGSGKTRVLVERFLRLLEENPGWRVSDIVAVTFTEKAAREMVSRIRREIRSRIKESKSGAARERWRMHRNALDSARIGTIHSLCASILRAHPAEASLDPAFEVMEEIEAGAFLEQAIQEAIDEAARETTRGQGLSGESDVIEIFTHMSPHDVREAVAKLVLQGERARRAVSKITRSSADQILIFWREALERLRADAARAIVEQESWARDAQTILSLQAIDPLDKREQCRAQVARLLDLFPSEDDPRDQNALAPLLLRVAACINLQGGSKKKWHSEEDFIKVKEALSRLRERVRSEKLLALELNELDRVAAEVTARLVTLYEKARARFTALKREHSRLDFNDLEEITERLLSSHGEVAARYTDPERGLARALMVDEFQDTSPVQKEILWRLAPRSHEFFIIGDSKQSIYRFRGADVTVFHEARAEFTSSGGREVGIDTCFRAHERLINFVNHVFPSIFTRESRYDTAYEAMSANRRHASDVAPVELHIITQDKQAATRLNAARLREAEARLIARRIKEIIEQEEVMVCERGRPARAARHDDFALLLQASTHFETYEQALAEANVPYVTIAGRGFYDRQEITDITNLLAFLVSPNDSLRLAAALRSPMFSLSDETLFRLRLKRRTLWQSLRDESLEQGEGEAEAVAFARDTLERLRAIVGRVSAAEIITAAVEETGYHATLMSLPHGERRCANLEKFIEQAHAVSSMTLSELVERTTRLRFREAREGEATIEEAGAVRLMTVHKSKGLEFPIVWVADASSRGGRDKDKVALHPDLGLSVNVEAGLIETGGEAARAASFEMLKRVEERMNRAEKKRLLYVAATRARDHLIISGGKASGDHWLGQILTALEVDEADSPRSASCSGSTVAIEWDDADELISHGELISNESGGADRDKKIAKGSMNLEQSQSAISSDESKTDYERFPLIRPLTS